MSIGGSPSQPGRQQPTAGQSTSASGFDRTDAMSRTLSWLFSQSFSNILVLAVLVANGFGIWYGIKEVQAGYERMADKYDAIRNRENEADAKSRESTISAMQSLIRELQFNRQAASVHGPQTPQN